MVVGVGSARAQRTVQAEHASLFVGCVRTGRRNCVRCAHGLAPCVPYTPATPLYLQCICQRGRRSHVILQNGSSTGRRCEWVGSCPTSLVGVGSARAPSSRSARAATALAARSMRRSAATRGSEDALLSFAGVGWQISGSMNQVRNMFLALGQTRIRSQSVHASYFYAAQCTCFTC